MTWTVCHSPPFVIDTSKVILNPYHWLMQTVICYVVGNALTSHSHFVLSVRMLIFLCCYIWHSKEWGGYLPSFFTERNHSNHQLTMASVLNRQQTLIVHWCRPHCAHFMVNCLQFALPAQFFFQHQWIRRIVLDTKTQNQWMNIWTTTAKHIQQQSLLMNESESNTSLLL